MVIMNEHFNYISAVYEKGDMPITKAYSEWISKTY